MGKKRKDHVHENPPQDVPRSRCSGTKFQAAIRRLPNEKVAAIEAIGFGGLLQLATNELRHELCNWLMLSYDVAYHRIHMGNSVWINVTLRDVEAAMGIPCQGLEVPLHPRRVVKGTTYSIQYLESKLESLPIGDEFIKIFLIFTCATILVPNSKPEGMHDLWDYIWTMDVSVPRNWGKLLLDYLEDGIYEFKVTKRSYVRGCLLFLQIFYMTKTCLSDRNVVVRVPWCSMWTDQLVKQRLATEIKMVGSYGLVEIRGVTPLTAGKMEEEGVNDNDGVRGSQEEDVNDKDSDASLDKLWQHAKEMVRVSQANLRAIERMRHLKSLHASRKGSR